MNRDLIQYRKSRAAETIQDALLLAEANRWNACVNRLYYACFYAVSSLLLLDGRSSTRHTGVRALFNLHYVREGIVSKDLARIYNDLFERRQEGDYVDFVHFKGEQVRLWLAQGQQFVDEITALINQGLLESNDVNT